MYRGYFDDSFQRLGSFNPGGCQLLTMATPRSKEFDKHAAHTKDEPRGGGIERTFRRLA